MNAPVSGPRAVDIAYIRFRAPDLGVMHKFLRDFGLQVTRGETVGGAPVLYARGTGADPFIYAVERGDSAFVGVGFIMPSAADLEVLAGMDGASPVEDMETPGGGRRVRFTDPQGFVIDGFFGWEEVEPIVPEQRAPINSGERRRRQGKPVRLAAGPSDVKRLGHVVLFVDDFRTSEAWYKERFGFVTSDDIWAGDESNVVGAFMRCNRGEVPTDHHSIFLMTSPDPSRKGLQHVAFEVNDWDDVMVGHDYLAQRDYRPQWGIGKHILGSQVFDYWHDPYGNILEHFTDGDLFDAQRPPGLHPVEILRSVQWGAQHSHG